MIPANELRIGNIARVANLVGSISAIDQDSGDDCVCMSFAPGYEYPPSAIDPIPLSPEWLERLGSPQELSINNNLCYIDLNQGQEFSGLCVDHIKYVHQLQNLYFALTGKELQVR